MIIEPLLSRFLVLEIPEYTFDEFREIAVTRLRKEDVDKTLAVTIAEKVWNELGSRDIRDVIKVARLTDRVQELSFVVKMLNRQFNRGR